MIDKQQDMKRSLDYLYKNELELVRLNQFVHELRKYDLAEILAYLADFPFQYVLNFLLSNPLLWVNMKPADWVKIMSALNPRPKPFKPYIEDAGYVDIHFLCKYVRINAIKLYLQQEKFTNNDKKKLLLYSNKVVSSLFMDELDTELLDGKYFVHIGKLENVRINLTSTGEIKELNYTQSELTKYIEKELKVL